MKLVGLLVGYKVSFMVLGGGHIWTMRHRSAEWELLVVVVGSSFLFCFLVADGFLGLYPYMS